MTTLRPELIDELLADYPAFLTTNTVGRAVAHNHFISITWKKTRACARRRNEENNHPVTTPK